MQSLAMNTNSGSNGPCFTEREESRNDPAIKGRRGVKLPHDQETSGDTNSKVAGRSNSPAKDDIIKSITMDPNFGSDRPTLEKPSTSSQQPMIKENLASTYEHRHFAESGIGHDEELTESERIQNRDGNGSTPGKGNMSEAAEDKSSVKVLPTIAKISQGITREEITKVKSSALGITYSIWDFGGQEIYYITHPLFLSWRSLYILVIPLHLELSDKAPREEDALKQLKGSPVRTHRTILELVHFWLMSVYTHAVRDSNHEPKVLLIGTFAGNEDRDIIKQKVTAKFQELEKRLGSKPYWKQVLSPMYGIDNQSSPDSEVKKIQEHIDGLVKDSAYMKVLMPIKWGTFLTAIEDSDQNTLTVEKAEQTMQTLEINGDKVKAVLKFYHDIGHLIYHQECELAVLKPQFLNNIVSNIITVIDDEKMKGDQGEYWKDLMERGILSEKLIKIVWEEHKGDHDQLDDIINMMIKFDLICEIPNERTGGRQFFVPCRSSSDLDVREIHPGEKDDKVEFTIDFHHFLPDGFLHRFFVRMAKWSMEKMEFIKLTFHYRQMVFCIDDDHRMVMTNEIHGEEGHEIKVMIYTVVPDGAPSEPEPATVNVNKEIIDSLHTVLDDLKEQWAKRIEYRVGIWCPSCAKRGYKEWFHLSLKGILKAQKKKATCAQLLPVYLGRILKAFDKAAVEVSTSKATPTAESRVQDFDDLLKTVAKWIPKNIDIDSLGRKLGFEPPEIERYRQTNEKYQTVTYMGTLSMLRDWRNKTTRSEEREQLKKALIAIGHHRLADDLLNDDVTGTSAVTRDHLQPKVEGIPNNPEPESIDENDTRGDNQSRSHGSEDGNPDGPPRNRNKKPNRKTDSTEEDERTRGENQTKSHGSKDSNPFLMSLTCWLIMFCNILCITFYVLFF